MFCGTGATNGKCNLLMYRGYYPLLVCRWGLGSRVGSLVEQGWDVLVFLAARRVGSGVPRSDCVAVVAHELTLFYFELYFSEGVFVGLGKTEGLELWLKVIECEADVRVFVTDEPTVETFTYRQFL